MMPDKIFCANCETEATHIAGKTPLCGACLNAYAWGQNNVNTPVRRVDEPEPKIEYKVVQLNDARRHYWAVVEDYPDHGMELGRFRDEGMAVLFHKALMEVDNG